jgi:hypothetical protein
MKIVLFLLLSLSLKSQHIVKFEMDDYAHAAAGYIVASGASGIASYYELKRPFLYGIGSAVVVGALKEGYDSLGNGTPEFQDFWMTFMGGILGSVVIEIPLSTKKKYYIYNEKENIYKK